MSDRIDAIVSLCRRRGFLYPSAEIYGGTRTSWDYGPLGVELKDNIRRQWWRVNVQGRHDVVGLDSAVLLPAAVWEASGHLEALADSITDCRACHRRWLTGPLLAGHAERTGEIAAGVQGLACPNCGSRDALTDPIRVGGLLHTHLGVVGEPGGVHYLRPETAQGIFVNVANVMATARRRPPFGIGQIGKSFRNELAPGEFIFRSAEHEQMELGYFVRPGTDEQWHEYWLDQRWSWYLDLGLPAEHLRRRTPTPMHAGAHTVDIEYRFGLPTCEWAGVEGVANRTDADLVAHSKHSGVDLGYFEQATGERWTPYVIATAAELDRCVLAFLLAAYAEDSAPNAKGAPEKRNVLRLDPRLAPVKVAVLPLSRNAELSPRARELAASLRRAWNTDFDDAGAIGRRYRRQDEIGTPFCVTLDFESIADQAATVRDRDSMKQDRVSLDRLPAYLAERLVGC